MNNEIYKIVSDYHTATQGPYEEEKAMEKIFEQAKITYGNKAVQDVVDYYNENVIRKAR
jgi:hypothetical protein